MGSLFKHYTNISIIYIKYVSLIHKLYKHIYIHDYNTHMRAY